MLNVYILIVFLSLAVKTVSDHGYALCCNSIILLCSSVQVLMALEKIWHIEHFVCAYCKRQLGTDIFYENDGLPYCELDYQELFLPKCADCHGAISDVSVRC